MKKTLIPAMTLLFAATALAKEPIRRTVVVKDGKVITDTRDAADVRDLALDSVLFGGPRAYLGVGLDDLTPELSEHFGGPKEAGVIIESVAGDSPAEKAGLRVGDIILTIDGKDVKRAADIRTALREKKEGDTVRLEVQRGRSRQTVVATVKEREAPRMFHFEELPGVIGSPEFRARLERVGDCNELQARIRELETRLKDLEKKLQK